MNELFDQRRFLIPFRATLLPQIFTDVLVIGSGVAGMRAALAAAEQQNGTEVIIATKAAVDKSNTSWAQGGISVVLDNEDSFEAHVQDTLTAGAGLCDEKIVRNVVEDAPQRISELCRWGMRFDRKREATKQMEPWNDPAADCGTSFAAYLALGREGGHSHHRIVHSDGDATGMELSRVLIEQARANKHIRLFDDCYVIDLITGNGSSSRCLGAITHHPQHGLQVIWAQATILATGGCGQVFRESTNPSVATGDGIAMAYRAGAAVGDMAFMQFHPTTLYIAGASRSLITEAVRGEGAKLIDRNGYRFMPDYHELAELAPRDIVSRAILNQMGATHYTHVYLDCRDIGAERFTRRFPGIFKLLKKFDLDPAKDPIPIHPSAHYMIGGVRVDDCGRTSVPGLYACGEVSCTGLNGANRLASNSLLEGLVFGRIVGAICHETIEPGNHKPEKIISDIRLSDRSELDLSDVRSSLRSVMWRIVGIEREGRRLNDVTEMIDFWARYTLDKIFDDREGWEVQNLLLIGALITRSAHWRTESRGTHFRLDYPQSEDAFACHDIWRRGQTEPLIERVNTSHPSDTVAQS